MVCLLKSTVSLLMIAMVASLPLGCAGAKADVSEDELAQIVKAVPQKARVEPERPRKLLVFTLCNGFVHDSIPCASKALQVMGEKTGAYEASVSDDISMFRPEKLAAFDAVCMNNTTGELFTDEALKESFIDFVAGGKGLIGIHAATDCCYKWSEYGEMIGGYFSGHPWHEKVGIKIDDPDHPVCTVFDGKGFEIVDEIYQFREPYSRDKLRVLLSLDMTKTERKGQRPDNDYAVSWVRSYGKGRVFYCSLGHRKEIFWNRMISQHYLDGIQFALGDLPAETTPIPSAAGKLTGDEE
jgi:type 1 glutamine amidotransferase